MAYEFERTTEAIKAFCLENHWTISGHTKDMFPYLVKNQNGYAMDIQKMFKRYELSQKQQWQFIYHCPTSEMIEFSKKYIAAFEFWLLSAKAQALGNAHIFAITFALS